MNLPANRLESCLLGTAVGDALGLPYENLTAERANRLIGRPDRFRFFLGRGMISDDTEHSCIVAQCLAASVGDEAIFERELAHRLRRWFLLLPAGIGRATFRSCLKLCFGFSPQRSGVFSAGNGPAMRAPILGAANESLDAALRLNRISARVTHTDPVALHGAMVVVIAAWGASRNKFADTADFFQLLQDRFAGEDAEATLEAMREVESSLASGESTIDFCRRFCGDSGATGYTLHTVPVAIHAWLRHRCQPGEAIRAAIMCGGDTDSVAAIVGGIAGCESEIAPELIAGICDWPVGVPSIRRLSRQLFDTIESGIPQRSKQPFFLWQLLRNLVFLSIVLGWGFRRLLPPY